jgi:hypothetical protein
LISVVALDGKRQRKLGAGWVAHQMRQIYADYSSLTPSHSIALEEIRFFYVPMIEGLCKLQKKAKE